MLFEIRYKVRIFPLFLVFCSIVFIPFYYIHPSKSQSCQSARFIMRHISYTASLAVLVAVAQVANSPVYKNMYPSSSTPEGSKTLQISKEIHFKYYVSPKIAANFSTTNK